VSGRGVALAVVLGLVLAVAVVLVLIDNRQAIVDARCQVNAAACPSASP
jgi:hypothetical protein